MSLHEYRIPQHLFDALASGQGGPAAVQELSIAQSGKHSILLWGVLNLVRGAVSEAEARMTQAGYELLTKVQRNDPVSAAIVIRYPAVGAWALHTVRTLRGRMAIPGAKPGQLSAVAAAAAIRARQPAEIDVPVSNVSPDTEPMGMVLLPTLGVAHVPGTTATIRVGGGEAVIVSSAHQVRIPEDLCQDAPGWHGIRRFRSDSFDAFIDDLDPFRMPAMANIAPRLSAAEISGWEPVWKQAWRLLQQYHDVIATEVAQIITVVVPLIEQGEGHASSSSPETFGAVAMSKPPDQYTCAATLVHEAQHIKLSALTDVVALTLPDDGRRFYAPWRPDPRPISGLLQGAYAHLGVSGFWRKQRQVVDGSIGLKAHTEFARWRVAAARVIETLRSSGQLTPAGLEFVQGMAHSLAAWQDEPVPRQAQTLAYREAELHMTRWQADNWPLPV